MFAGVASSAAEPSLLSVLLGSEGREGSAVANSAPSTCSRQVVVWVIDVNTTLLFAEEGFSTRAGDSSSLHSQLPPPPSQSRELYFWKVCPFFSAWRGEFLACRYRRVPCERVFVLRFQELLDSAVNFVRSRITAGQSLLFALLLFKAEPKKDRSSQDAGLGGSTAGLCFPGMHFAVPLQEADVSTVETLRSLALMDQTAFEAAFAAPLVKPPLSGKSEKSLFRRLVGGAKVVRRSK